MSCQRCVEMVVPELGGPLCLWYRVKRHKADKLNSYELLAPLEQVVPGLGGPVCLRTRVKQANIVWVLKQLSLRLSKNEVICRFWSKIKAEKIQVRGHHWNCTVSCKAIKTVETVLIIDYICTHTHTAILYIQAGGVDKGLCISSTWGNIQRVRIPRTVAGPAGA
jgi:hypothetical protein